MKTIILVYCKFCAKCYRNPCARHSVIPNSWEIRIDKQKT